MVDDTAYYYYNILRNCVNPLLFSKFVFLLYSCIFLKKVLPIDQSRIFFVLNYIFIDVVVSAVFEYLICFV